MEMLHTEITGKIINSFYKVYNELGFGFLEKVYENAMLYGLNAAGLYCERQKQLKVYYNDKIVGGYFADIVINETIIIELKAEEALVEEHELQLINYLKVTNLEIWLLLNFGKNLYLKENSLQMTENKSAQTRKICVIRVPSNTA